MVCRNSCTTTLTSKNATRLNVTDAYKDGGMRRYLLFVAAALLAAQVNAKEAGEFWQPGAAENGPRWGALIPQAKREITGPEPLPIEQVGRDTVLVPWNRLSIKVEDVSDPIYFLSQVSPQADVRKTAEECVLKLSALDNVIYQSVPLHRRFKALAPADAIDTMARTIQLEQFEDRGVNLPADNRQEARKIFDRLDKLH